MTGFAISTEDLCMTHTQCLRHLDTHVRKGNCQWRSGQRSGVPGRSCRPLSTGLGLLRSVGKGGGRASPMREESMSKVSRATACAA